MIALHHDPARRLAAGGEVLELLAARVAAGYPDHDAPDLTGDPTGGQRLAQRRRPLPGDDGRIGPSQVQVRDANPATARGR